MIYKVEEDAECFDYYGEAKKIVRDYMNRDERKKLFDYLDEITEEAADNGKIISDIEINDSIWFYFDDMYADVVGITLDELVDRYSKK